MHAQDMLALIGSHLSRALPAPVAHAVALLPVVTRRR